MGQNNDTREHGDKQGHQGGQLSQSPKTFTPQEVPLQQQRKAPPEEPVGGSNADKKANQTSRGKS